MIGHELHGAGRQHVGPELRGRGEDAGREHQAVVVIAETRLAQAALVPCGLIGRSHRAQVQVALPADLLRIDGTRARGKDAADDRWREPAHRHQ